MIERLAGRHRPVILDVGCGNGRLGDFVAARLGDGFRYVGLDSSPALLEIAAAESATGGGERRFLERELAEAEALAELPWAPFDLACVFGVLHHLPALAERRRLLGRLARLVAPGGWMALAFWQFGGRPRFARRRVPWSARPEIDPAQLEPGDTLLAWGEDASTEVRYCHHADPEEAVALAASTGLAIEETFSSDGEGGDQNLYIVLRSPAGNG